MIAVGDNFATCCDVKDNYVVTGHRGFSGNGCDVKLWDFRKKEEVLVIKEHQQSVEAVIITDNNLISCAKDGKIVRCGMDGKIVDVWEHPQAKPFVAMQKYKEGILAANIEPKVMFFNIDPLANEF